MNRLNESGRGSDQRVYEVWLDGCLDPCWASWFGATDVRCHGQNQGQDQTVLLCPVADQAALYGLLRKVRDLGLSLAAIKRIDTGSTSERGKQYEKGLHCGCLRQAGPVYGSARSG